MLSDSIILIINKSLAHFSPSKHKLYPGAILAPGWFNVQNNHIIEFLFIEGDNDMIKQPKRQAKFITDPKDLEYLFSLNEDLACKTSTMMECFGKFGDKRRFNPYDIISIPPNTFGIEGHKNKKGFTTTVGLWIFNKAFTECGIFPITGYVNDTINKKLFKKLNKQISYAVMEDRLDIEELKKYTLKTQKFQPYCNILSPSLSEGLLGMSAEIKKEKETLIKQNTSDEGHHIPFITSIKPQ